MQINVTREDIELGEPARSFKCAVARALERETGQRWRVDEDELTRADGYSLPCPPEVEAWLTAYDESPDELRLAMRPIAFDLPVVCLVAHRPDALAGVAAGGGG